MNQEPAVRRLCIGEIIVCVLGLGASVIPFLVYTDPFWGVSSIADKELFATTSEPGVVVLQVNPESPAASAGIQPHDRIEAVNGNPVGMGSFLRILSTIETGQTIALHGKRAAEDLRLEYQGEPRRLEGVLVLDWQFASAPIFLVLLIVLIATEPLVPQPMWRAILTTICGLTVVFVIVIVEITQWIPWTPVWRARSISHSPSPGIHVAVGALAILAGLTLAILGAFDIRAVLSRRLQASAGATL